LARFDDPHIAPALIKAATPQAVDVLLSRPASSLELLLAVDAGRVERSAIASEKLRRLATYSDPRIDALVRKHWGNVAAGTTEEKLATVRRLSNDLRAFAGDAGSGRKLFFQHCASCHRLKGDGGPLAMDLTAANRSDRMYLLTHVVDPGAFIRKEYVTMEVHARDGRTVRGLVAEDDASGVTLLSADYQRTRIRRADIARMEESAVSLMPEGILEKLTPQQLRDLFAYLEAK
jgi:putative heme-binding domain-containing protein